MADFESFGLSAPVLEAINKMGFVEASPIQKKAIPLIMAGRDLLGQAQTGTGKTAAFGIPMAQLLANEGTVVQALVLSPTRELAVQISEEVHELTLFTGHKVLPIYGGQRIDRQITALKKGVQIVVGTPGRILDHLGRRTLSLDSIKMLVLDEADMMLDMGFLPDIRRIIRQCATDRQTLLFSATIPSDIERIARDYMKNPESVSVVPETLTLEETEQIFYEVPEDEKIDALTRLLDNEQEGASAIIFCRTKRNVDKLTRKLKALGYDVEGLHGDLTQAQRDQIMHGFREERFSYLIATDVASRGLDISHVTHVINYHVPQDPEAYVHRIGRTGRMGRSGVAITFVTPAEYWDLLRIQEFSMAQISEGELPTDAEVDERRRAARGDSKAKRRVEKVDRAGARPPRRAVADGPVEPEVAAGALEMVEAAEAVEPAEAPSKTRRRRKEPTEQLPLTEFLQGADAPTTEAGRDQRRYVLRDARKRIGWVDHDEALKEASRIEKDELIEVAHISAVDEAGPATEETDDTAAATRAAAEEARRADVLERLRAAEAAIEAEGGLRAKAPVAAAAAEEPLIAPDEEARIMRALRLRDRVSRLVASLDLEGLDDFRAIVARLEMDNDLQTITAALIKELAGRETDAVKTAQLTRIGSTVGGAEILEEAPADEDEHAEADEADEAPIRSDGTGVEGGEMTRLFISIGRRARVNREGLERLVRESAGIDEDDIGRVDLLHNFAFIEVRKAVASRVIEGMHETMFKGREISVEPAKSSAKDE